MMYRFYMLLTLLLVQAPAFGLEGYGVTQEEKILLPDLCRNHALLRSFDDAGCKMLNHYCYGLAHMMRVDKHTPESGYWLTVALDDFQSATNHAEASCPLLPELHVTLGRALLRKAAVSGDKSGDAAENFIKALTQNPDYLPAYYALSDYYANLGDKKQALSVIEDGLRHVPNSKGLLRRFKELGGTTPPAPVAITSESKVTEVAKDRPV